MFICALYAIWYFVVGEWSDASIALSLGSLLEFLTSAAARRGLLFLYVSFAHFRRHVIDGGV